MRRLPAVLQAVVVLCMTTFTAIPAFAQTYDVVILNGRVMDPETNFDGVRNVGVNNGKITAITKEQITARKPSMPRGMWCHRGLSILMSTS